MTRIITILLIALSSFTYSQKMNGISVKGEQYKPNFSNFSHFTQSNANWVSVQAFGFVKSGTSGVDFNRKNYWHSQTIEGITSYIQSAKKNKFKVMLKPHTIVQYGEYWSGNLNYTGEKNWKKLEKTYSTYILTLAKLAEKHKVEALSIGVELENFFTRRKRFVTQLIKDVRAVYSGKITYCANWDECEEIYCWSQLDFIGVDAYFSFSQEKTPTLGTCYKELTPIKIRLAKLSRKYKKKIVFTEFGFRSRDFTCADPWKWENYSKVPVNLKAQAIAYQAIFDIFWNEKWFLGGFSWRWQLDYGKCGGKYDNSYTPQNKLAEQIISNHYGKYKN